MAVDPVVKRLLGLLEESAEEERLGDLLSIDRSGPIHVHEARYLPLAEWLRRSEEVHHFRAEAPRRELQTVTKILDHAQRRSALLATLELILPPEGYRLRERATLQGR